MKKVLFVMSFLLFTTLSYGQRGGLVAIPNGIYLFESGSGEQIQISINNRSAIINASGNMTYASLIMDEDGDLYYKNKQMGLVLAFANPCQGYIRVRGTEEILYNTVSICR